jgi:Na+-driven multidrug efflux pump
MLLLTLLVQWRAAHFVRFFTTDAEVVAVGAGYLRIISWNFVASGLIFSCSGMFQALGNTWPSILSSATRLVTFVAPALAAAQLPGFRLEHVWYLSVASVALQLGTSLWLLRGQLRARLAFAAGGTPRP